jgi:tetratricopeptide (TPR) repeat protein
VSVHLDSVCVLYCADFDRYRRVGTEPVGERVAEDGVAAGRQRGRQVLAGQDGEAGTVGRLLGAAASLAQESGDLSLAAWALARRGEQEIHEKNTGAALACTSAAVALARTTSPAVRAFLLAKQALALSMTGDRAAALHVLAEMHAAAEQAGATDEPRWIGRYGRGHLWHEEGRCYYNLGMGAEAARAAEESMKIRSRDRFARPRAFSLGVQAIGYAQAGEVERACAVATELVAMTSQLASARVRIRLAEALEALQPYRDVAVVRDLREAAQPVLALARSG